MRRTTFIWLACAALCGTVLFHTSQQVSSGRARIAVLSAETEREEESLRVLAAEWSYLNQPDRLEKLAATHLDLAPVKAAQFVAAGTLASPPPPVEEEKEPPAKAEEEPAVEKAVATPPVKILKPVMRPAVAERKLPAAPPPAPRAAPAPPPPKTATGRSFGDLLDSLGAGR